ncbi:MAG: dipeptidase [Desulfobacteraceae bacterium]|nr:dipeptidase [Desulfobacteraceae bacterium]
MHQWQAYLDDHQDEFLNDLRTFLSIPSVSSLSRHRNDVQQAADWVATRMEKAGIEAVRVLATHGHPVVYGHCLQQPDKPTIVIYGHFDTQPVDPVEEWTHPPFDPVVTEDRIYARGASDDKGNMLIPILTTEAILKTGGKLPINVKFFFEGQEEIGSPDLPAFMDDHKALFACDMVISADGGQWGEDQPSVIMGLRGLCGVQIDITGADSDLHSGTYGGTIMNPIHALCRLLSSLHQSDGRVAVHGFYDDVLPVTDAQGRHISAIEFDERQYCDAIGAGGLFGEKGYSTYERAWVRPTLEVNGIWGGFQEEGTKTVLPSQAHAKITCRLVPNQDPDQIVDLIHTHINKYMPDEVQVSVTPIKSKALPYLVPEDHPGNRAVASVYRQIYSKSPYYAQMGGSVPICGLFLEKMKVYTIVFAFGLNDENIHAPDEFFRLGNFRKGLTAYGLLFESLAGQ